LSGQNVKFAGEGIGQHNGVGKIFHSGRGPFAGAGWRAVRRRAGILLCRQGVVFWGSRKAKRSASAVARGGRPASVKRWKPRFSQF